jgi:hypothetical protein
VSWVEVADLHQLKTRDEGADREKEQTGWSGMVFDGSMSEFDCTFELLG